MMRFLALLGTPSITLIALVAGYRLFSRRERTALLSFAAALSLVLYGGTLAYFPFDLYRAGFSPWAPVVLATIGIAIAPRSLPLALTILGAIVAYDIPLFRSVNLFDYVVDPILGLAAIAWICILTFRRLYVML
ncbi:MAG TPA: hypothetical protein VG323_06970 [Thermoanaerobaculia bacterium]|nr:hypothetical protein [Thermoanaerobaculia bacterium]